MRLRDNVLASVCILAFAATAMAQTTFTTVLSGANEVPANGSAATGSATAVLNAAQTTLTITCQYQNLGTVYSASHIHAPATITANASARFGFIGNFNPPNSVPWVFANGSKDGTLTNYVSPIAVTAADVTNLFNGLDYVNVHSQGIPGGEIRGQLGSAPVPARSSTWARVKLLYR